MSMRILLLLCCLWCGWIQLHAHNMPVSVVQINFDEDGNFTIHIRFDVDSCINSIANPSPELLEAIINYSQARWSGPANKELTALAQRICDQVQLEFGTERVKPELIELDIGPDDDPTRTQTAQFKGKAPSAETRCRWIGNPYLKIVNLHIENHQVAGAFVEIIQDFGDSSIYAGVPTNHIDIAIAYTVEGILHVVPAGLDHVLFIVGLFFAMSKMSHLFWQVSAFTIAHTLTLGLMSAGCSAPNWLQSMVEPCIALSIAFVAFENCFFKDMKRWRPLLVFFFGLIHGMGFASVLGDLGIPDDYFWAALLSFNIGVEIAQVLIIALLAACFYWAARKDWYHKRIVIPVSCFIGMYGLYLFAGTI